MQNSKCAINKMPINLCRTVKKNKKNMTVYIVRFIDVKNESRARQYYF